MKTWQIHIEGQVQGVGFRPFVYKTALNHNIKGWVINGLDGVHIRFNATPTKAKQFYHQIIQKAPSLSRIMEHFMQEVDNEIFESFDINLSDETGFSNLLITPDFALCQDCETELLKKGDRRYNYPFITCINCGPRYSIIRSLPYDRPRTTMETFQMCTTCEKEYSDPLERRHYSQTNSCENCGIQLTLEHRDGSIESFDADLLIEKASRLILGGNILGVKGIGGYLIFADATNEKSIQLLRDRKNRPKKPFALMYPDILSIKQDAYLSKDEKKLVRSIESPIVLLRLKDETRSGICLDKLVPGLNEIGVMLPYTPLFVLMMKKIRKPVIATSGNISGSPVIFSDDLAKRDLLGICDYILSNDREIVVPQDDSVEKIRSDGRKLILRRSRGYAPNYVHRHFKRSVPDMLAMGAMMKSTFALTHHGNTYVSQYLGDLESYDTQKSYNHTIQHFLNLFKPKPSKVLMDLHPDYFSTQKGKEIGKELGIQVREIQHHEAHLMAVLAENNLLQSDKKVLGVVWDGTGLGSDGQIWGGEYFIYQDNKIYREDHLPYFNHILEDKFSREPRLAALSLCHTHCLNSDSLKSRFSDEEWSFYGKILDNKENLKTSSMGRLFDGVSNILGIINQNTFEGEAAMYLQAIAQRFANENGMIDNTFITLDGGLGQCLNELMIGTNAGIDKGKMAYDFHNWLVYQIRDKAIASNAEKIVFSGGVFQNSLLLFLLGERLGSEFELYYHKQLSPNDESISFGQLVYEYSGVKTSIHKSKKAKIENVGI